MLPASSYTNINFSQTSEKENMNDINFIRESEKFIPKEEWLFNPYTEDDTNFS